MPQLARRFLRSGGRWREPPYLVLADGNGEAWWRISDLAEMPDGRLVEAGITPPLRVFSRCEPDGRIRRPVVRRAVQLTAGERQGYFVELLVEQFGRATPWQSQAVLRSRL